MGRFLLAFWLLVSMPVFAQQEPASEASIRELMELTNTKSLLNQTYGQIDGLMQQAIKDALGGRELTAEQEQLVAELRAKTVEVLTQEMGWEILEPAYIKMYQGTFTQSEVDGINGFYRSEAGKAVIAKMPQLMTATMQLVMDRMKIAMPKVQAVRAEFEAKLAKTR